MSISGVAAVGLILLFIGLIKSKFKQDGYHQIVGKYSISLLSFYFDYNINTTPEGKQITIDEVRLGPRIGKGNFGEVHKAYWRGAEIAVKKLPAHNMTDQFLKDFHKEVSLMRLVKLSFYIFMSGCALNSVTEHYGIPMLYNFWDLVLLCQTFVFVPNICPEEACIRFYMIPLKH